jgi:UDP-N-acetylmuramate--alanine ligase
MNTAKNASRNDLQIETYSVCPREGDWYAQSIEYKEDVTQFDVFFKKQKLGTASIKLVGQHNVGNFLAALAGSMHAGVDFTTAAQAARTFKGARRRFELVGEITIPDGSENTENYPISVIDDYAHHPTEIRATIRAAKNRYPNRRIIACFQPHTFSRTKYLLDEFISCFEGVDSLLLLKTFAAREDPVDGLSARDLADLIENIEVSYVASIDQAVAATVKKIEPGDVFISIGAGDVTRVPWLLLPELQKAVWSRAIGDDA